MTPRLARCFSSLFLFAGLASAADSQLVNLLPSTTKLIAGINVGQAKDTPFGKFLLARMSAQSNPTKNIGFDPRTDLDEVLIGTSAQVAQQGVALARGTFNTQVILAAAQAAGQTIETYHDVPILTGPQNSTVHAVAFLGSSIAIAGDVDSVEAAIDRRTATSPAIDASLVAQIEQQSGTYDVWSISTIPLASLASQKLPDQQLNTILNSDLLKSIQQSTGGVKFGQNVQFSGQAVADTSQNATALADLVRFLGTMVQANAPDDASAATASLLQTLSVQTNGNTLTLAAAIPESQLENLVIDAHSH